MDQKAGKFSIGSFASSAGVNVETIRFYQRKGLLPMPRKPGGGSVHRYGDADVARVRFIKSAQRLGFSLGEVAQLLELEDGTHCCDVRVLAQQKLVDIRGKLADLHRIEAALSSLVQDCCERRETERCPLIVSLQR
ncbi:MerR family transcriptional regulator [Variovorax sp. 350MFTsu5.1]|uniref:MerR family transcriptional regulator n=1 Tax=Variovorax sp. 350MFTsu5.1 TaxID=3158365 RepID=UPI003AACBD69